MKPSNRTILHVDCDAFYASVECLLNPTLRGKPVAVIGDPELRHGIVLAKSQEAKRFGVQTGDALWQARQKCKDITFVPAQFDQYLKFSHRTKEIFADYSDRCESFGLDESWIDLTGCTSLFGDGPKVANEIRGRVKEELGITASVGVSFNKVFAKLGSDMNKPDGTTIIPYDSFREKVWPLPVKDLLYVGRATTRKLQSYGIRTIGDLARTQIEFLERRFGKVGRMLWMFANGLDTSPVSNIGAKSLIKSVGNSTTVPRDLVTSEDIRITLYALCESVAQRLREHGFRCRTVVITIRDNELFSYERQMKLERPSCTAREIFDAAYALCQKHHADGKPVRSLGVRASTLLLIDSVQLSLYPDVAKAQARERLEEAIDGLRGRFGHFCVQWGIMLTDPQLSALNPVEDHIIHPIGFLT
ncbi:DNA polymerase IV [Anaerotruncus rubiinfantis]|uniref:DNA polymerase IV n=1 Tax=Anaerotruncus rubiinfantis TaxID=1720200 RepID=UPI00083342BC|nr:DNA polymerase IV [Anaerotruncus rubiinfantis]